MLNNALVIIKPAVIPRALIPVYWRILNAIRLWKFHFCIAIAIMKPPANRNWTLFINSLLTTPISSTEKIGKRIKGNKEVIGNGNASVPHQIPINKKIAKRFEKEIIFDGKLEYNNFLEQLYPNESNLIQKTNKYYTDKPLRLYLLSECKIKNNKYYILKDNNIILNIIKLSLHPRSLDDFEGLTYSMKYKLSNVKSNKDDNCFIITSTSLEYINIDDEYESIEMPYYKKKEISLEL